MSNHLTTKEKILTAAKELFTKYGFAGTSMGMIAKLAQVNHSLLFHHFGNKENLWIEVKQTIAKDINNKSKTLPNLNLSFPVFLKKLIKNSVDFYQSNPDIVRMLNWQRVEYNDQKNIGLTLSSESRFWIDSFKHFQNKGDVNKEYSPEFIMTLVLSIVSSAAMDPNVFISNEECKLNYINFCVEVLQKALK